MYDKTAYRECNYSRPPRTAEELLAEKRRRDLERKSTADGIQYDSIRYKIPQIYKFATNLQI